MLLLIVPRRYPYLHLILRMSNVYFWRVDAWLAACVCLYMYACALLERWVYVLCYVSCMSFFLPIKPPVVIYFYWPCQGGTLIFTFFSECLTCIFLTSLCMIGGMYLSVCVCVWFAWEVCVCFLLRFLHDLKNNAVFTNLHCHMTTMWPWWSKYNFIVCDHSGSIPTGS